MASLRSAGWPLPPRLPGHLALLAAAAGATRTGPVIDLDYSDGLFAVSVFIQRGHLPAEMPGWSRIAVAGYPAYTDQFGDRSIAWSSGGFVYTVLSGAPSQTGRQVAVSLAHAPAPGFFGRIRNGLRKLVSWLSP
jgi:sigma-E factor negative regulatory protein RseB